MTHDESPSAVRNALDLKGPLPERGVEPGRMLEATVPPFREADTACWTRQQIGYLSQKDGTFSFSFLRYRDCWSRQEVQRSAVSGSEQGENAQSGAEKVKSRLPFPIWAINSSTVSRSHGAGALTMHSWTGIIFKFSPVDDVEKQPIL